MTVSIIAHDGTTLEHPDLFDEAGTLQPMPAAFWAEQPRQARQIFGHKHGLYSFPTLELIATLKGMLPAGTLEIGAGNGGYCKALEIRGTDSYMQELPEIKAHYAAHGQPTVNYGAHVEKIDANAAVKKYRPRAILAAWVTHRFDPLRPELGGNAYGVNERQMIDRLYVEQYFFIGNSGTHRDKPLLLDLAAQKITSHIVDVQPLADCSRAAGGIDFLAVITRRREVF